MCVSQSCPTFCNPTDCCLPGSSVYGILQARILEWVAMPSSGDLPNPGIKPCLLHCGWIPYHLSHQGSSRTLEWVAYPFSRGSSWPRNQTGISCIAVRFFTSWATREAQIRKKEQVERGRKRDKKKLKIKLGECCILKKSREQEFQEREWVCCVHWCWKVV